MKIIDILSHQSRDLAGAVQARERTMTTARRRLGKTFLHDEAPPPGLVAHLAARHEGVERDRLVLAPQAPGGAEIRNATFRGYPRPGKRDDCPRALDQVT